MQKLIIKPPSANILIESMRSIGYTFESAVADIIDNSISANATRIDLFFLNNDNPILLFIDNGIGMNKNELEDAMRYGSKDPLSIRNKNDLGRFGLGMKTASLSQCRKMTVVSKRNNALNGYSWDLDIIQKYNDWKMIHFSEDEIMSFPYIDKLLKYESGTYIIWEDFDRVEVTAKNIIDTIQNHLINTIDYLSLIFHRFLEENIKILLNNNEVEPIDPFLKSNAATLPKREQIINYENEIIKVKPYILPHISMMKEEEIKKLGGVEKLRLNQGFYVYRNKRLIIYGTWFRMNKMAELGKLARVQVDIPNSLDYLWQIDIKKSTANLPDKIKSSLIGCVEDSIGQSENVISYRGRKPKSDSDELFVWEERKTRGRGTVFTINRELPLLKMIESQIDSKTSKKLERLLIDIENNCPFRNIYLAMSREEIANDLDVMSDNEIVDAISLIENFIKNENGDFSLVDVLIRTEPYNKSEKFKLKYKEKFLDGN